MVGFGLSFGVFGDDGVFVFAGRFNGFPTILDKSVVSGMLFMPAISRGAMPYFAAMDSSVSHFWTIYVLVSFVFSGNFSEPAIFGDSGGGNARP